jgi:hypothetical protein
MQMMRKNSEQAVRTRRRRTPLLVAIGAVVGFGAFAPLVAVPAGASSSAAPTGTTGNTGSSSAAVVTPLLRFFVFGNTVGLPLLCSDAGSVVSIIGASSNSAKETSKLVTELDDLCAKMASAGTQYLNEGIAKSEALTFINPVVDPLIADLDNGLQTVGTQYGPSLAPFGPTVAGLGGTVSFFEGS